MVKKKVTVKNVVILNDLTETMEYPKMERKLDAEWLLQNTFFFITGDGIDSVAYSSPMLVVPYEVLLEVIVTDPYSAYFEESTTIPLATIKYKKGSPREIVWLDEKKLEKEIKREMKAICIKFADDVLPAALTIAKRAQVQAKKLIDEYARKMKAEIAEAETTKKITKKSAKKRNGKVTKRNGW